MELNGKAGNPGLAANSQIQDLQYAIEFTQIVVDQMDGKIGRLLHWINPKQAGDAESGRGTMCLKLIDLHPGTLPGAVVWGALMASTAPTVRSSGEPVQSTLTLPCPAESKPKSR